jgi:arginine-tRNA-protein transferase
MRSLFTFTAPTRSCSYLPEQRASLEYEFVAELSPAEYLRRMLGGWRRFGHLLFHPACEACRGCRALRVSAERFRPDRSQRRARRRNEGEVELRIGTPAVTREKLDLYDRYHAFQAGHKGWPSHSPKDAEDYYSSFVQNPFPTEEWCYELDGRLAGVGYVDRLPGGLSAIYFFHDPDDRGRGLGVWNVLSVIDRARGLGLPHVYLGYYVEGCDSMTYKADFVPNQTLGPDGRWTDFRP